MNVEKKGMVWRGKGTREEKHGVKNKQERQKKDEVWSTHKNSHKY